MSSDRERLAEYQAKLLDSLHTATSVEEAAERLDEVLRSADLQAAFGKVDQRMLDVAIQLTKKWGVTKD